MGNVTRKSQKIIEKVRKTKILNTFLKMILVFTMVHLMFFVTDTRKTGLYYGENRSSRFVNRLYYGENGKKRVFLCLF